MDPYEGFPPGFQSLMEWTPPARTRAGGSSTAPLAVLEDEDEEEESFVDRLLGRARGLRDYLADEPTQDVLARYAGMVTGHPVGAKAIVEPLAELVSEPGRHAESTARQVLGGLAQGGVSLGQLGLLGVRGAGALALDPSVRALAGDIYETGQQGATGTRERAYEFAGEPSGVEAGLAGLGARMVPEALPYVAAGPGKAGLGVGSALDVLFSQLPKEETLAGAVEQLYPGFAPIAESRLGRAGTELLGGLVPGAAQLRAESRAAARRVADIEQIAAERAAERVAREAERADIPTPDPQAIVRRFEERAAAQRAYDDALAEQARFREGRSVRPELLEREEIEVTPDYVAQLLGEARAEAAEAPPRIRDRRAAAGLPPPDIEAAARAREQELLGDPLLRAAREAEQRAELAPIQVAPGRPRPHVETIEGQPYARTDSGVYIPIAEEPASPTPQAPDIEAPRVPPDVPAEPEVPTRVEQPPEPERVPEPEPESAPLQPVSGSIRAFEAEIDQLTPGSPKEVGTDLVKVRRTADGGYLVSPAGEEPQAFLNARAAVDYAAGAEDRFRGDIAEMDVTEPVKPQKPRRVKAAQTTPDLATKGQYIVEGFPRSQMKLVPEVMQYKVENVGEGGSASLKNIQKWDPNAAGVVLLWRDPKTGENLIVNGHGRVGAGDRLGVTKHDVRFIEAETAEEARATGALTNIKEGRGTPVDAAKFLRDTGTTVDELRAEGVELSEALIRDALALKNLHPTIFGAVSRQQIPMQRAVVIGGSGLPENLQLDLVKQIAQRERSGRSVTNAQIKELADEIRGTGVTSETQETLFGMETFERSNIWEKAEVSAYVRQAFAQDKKLFGPLSKAERATRIAGAGVGEIDVARAAEIGQEAEQGLGVFDLLKNRSSELNDILNEEAAALAAGRESPNVIKARALQRTKDAVAALAGGQAPGRTAGSTPRAPGTPAGAAAEEPAAPAGEVDLFGESRPPEPTRPEVEEPPAQELRYGGGPSTEQIVEVAARAEARARYAAEVEIPEAKRQTGQAIRVALSEATDVLRSGGATGQKLARETEEMTQALQARFENQTLDTEKALEPIRRGHKKKDREAIGRYLMGRTDGSELTADQKRIAEELRAVWDRDLADAQRLGFQRTRPDGTWVPVAGSGAPMPQVLNKKGRQEMARLAARNGGVSPRLQGWAEELAERKGIPIEEALADLQKLADPNTKRTVGYLERSRTLLPEEWVELDPLQVYRQMAMSNATALEAARKWGIDYSMGKPQYTRLVEALDDLGGEFDESVARSLKRFYETELGSSEFVQPFHQRAAAGFSNYQTIVRMGGSVLAAVRNAGQPITNLPHYPISVRLKAYAKYPPIVHRWMKEASRLEEEILRSGAVSPRAASIDIQRGTGERLTTRLMTPFMKVEKGNQIRTALVARIGLEYDMNRLAKLQGQDGALSNFLRGISERRVDRVLDTPADELAAKITRGERMTPKEMEEAGFRLVNDTQFPINFATKTTWWDSHPWVRATVAKFKTFGIRQLELIHETVLKEAAHGNMAPLGRFVAGTILIGELYNIARDNLLGSEESLTMRTLRRDKVTGNEVYWTLAKNLLDGGGIGMLADLAYGIDSWAIGPAHSTYVNAKEFADAVGKNPSDLARAAWQFTRREVSVGRQIGGARRLITGADRYFDYNQIRNRAYEWRFSHENPSLGGKVGAKAGEIIKGRRDFESTDRTLRYRYAADAITAENIDDAAEYLATILENANPSDRKDLVAGMKGSMRSKAPLGQVGQENLPAFRRTLSPREWEQAKALHKAWIRDYERALSAAIARAR